MPLRQIFTLFGPFSIKAIVSFYTYEAPGVSLRRRPTYFSNNQATILFQSSRSFTVRPWKSVRPWKYTIPKKDSSRLPFPTFFRGELLNFGGVMCFKPFHHHHFLSEAVAVGLRGSHRSTHPLTLPNLHRPGARIETVQAISLHR